MTQPAHAIEAAALMRAMVSGDRMALGRLITLYGRGVRSYCARALDISSDAEDAAQEVFLKLWSSAAQYDADKASVATWLYRIALRHCIDRNRRGRVRRFFGMGGDAVVEVEDAMPGAAHVIGARQDLALIRVAVQALPDRQRQALLLKAVAEMDTATIAAVMGTGVGAVEQLLVRARATLRARAGLELG